MANTEMEAYIARLCEDALEHIRSDSNDEHGLKVKINTGNVLSIKDAVYRFLRKQKESGNSRYTCLVCVARPPDEIWLIHVKNNKALYYRHRGPAIAAAEEYSDDSD